MYFTYLVYFSILIFNQKQSLTLLSVNISWGHVCASRFQQISNERDIGGGEAMAIRKSWFKTPLALRGKEVRNLILGFLPLLV